MQAPFVTRNGKSYKHYTGFDLVKVAKWQYGHQFDGNLYYNRKDAYSWRAGLKTGGKGSFDLARYVRATYQSGAIAHCCCSKNAYSWAVYIPHDPSEE